MSKASSTQEERISTLWICRELQVSLCAVVVLIGDGLQPDGLALCSRCDRDIGEAVIRCCAVPVLYTRSAFDHVSLVNDARRLSSLLVVAGALGDEQNLTTRMNVPVQLCTCIVRRHGNARIKRAVSYIELTEPDLAGVILRVRKFTLGEAGSRCLCLRLWDE